MKLKKGAMDLTDPRKKRYIYLMLSIFGGISLSILVFFFVYRFQGVGEAVATAQEVLAPFIIGGAVAYLLRPVCNAYERQLARVLPPKMKKAAGGLSVALSLLTGLLIVYAVIIMILPQLVTSIVTLWSSIPGKVSELLAWAQVTFANNEKLIDIANNLYSTYYVQIESWVREFFQPYLNNIMGFVSGVGTGVYRVFKALYNILIGLIVACYLLSSRKQFARQGVLIVRSVLKPKWADALLGEIRFVDRVFGDFIDGKLLDSAIIGVLCYIGCLIFRFPNALLVSAIVGVTNVIPYFGPFIGGVPATLLIMIESPIKGLWFIIFILALQQLDGNVIGPKILGDRTGLSSFWVLFSIIAFGSLWGVAGMFIAVPVFAVIYDIIKKLVRRGLKRQEQVEVWEKYKADYPDEPGT